MMTTNIVPIMGEYEAQREYLATASINVAELVEKTLQMLVFIKESHIGKE